jgi:hypothetical protein
VSKHTTAECINIYGLVSINNKRDRRIFSVESNLDQKAV